IGYRLPQSRFTFHVSRFTHHLSRIPAHSQNSQFHSARIFSAFFTSPADPVKANFNFPALRVTSTLMEVSPSRFIRTCNCLYASLIPCFWRLLFMVQHQRAP